MAKVWKISFLLFVPVFSFRGSEYLHVLFYSFFCLCVLSQTSPPFPSSPSHHTLASSLPTASVYLTLFLSLLLVPLLAAVATLCQQFHRRLGKEGAMIWIFLHCDYVNQNLNRENKLLLTNVLSEPEGAHVLF